jgi:hypothetical protein
MDKTTIGLLSRRAGLDKALAEFPEGCKEPLCTRSGLDCSLRVVGRGNPAHMPTVVDAGAGCTRSVSDWCPRCCPSLRARFSTSSSPTRRASPPPRSHEERGCQVRNGLSAGGSRIRTIGPATSQISLAQRRTSFSWDDWLSLTQLLPCRVRAPGGQGHERSRVRIRN